MTKNKWYRVFGIVLLLSGIFLVAMAFAAKGRPAGTIPWLRLGPMGLMCIVGGGGVLVPSGQNQTQINGHKTVVRCPFIAPFFHSAPKPPSATGPLSSHKSH